MPEFYGKTVLVTGAGRGIGQAVASLFAAQGAFVVVCDLTTEASEATAENIRQGGGKAVAIACDVSNEGQVDALFERIIAEYGRIDCAVNNAGIDPELQLDPAWDIDQFDRVMGVNVRSIYMCMKREIDHMRAEGGGIIVNMGSLASVTGVPFKPAYTASKHAILGLTRAAALFYARFGIRINVVCPGSVDTSLIAPTLAIMPGGAEALNQGHPMGRMAQPSEIAEAVLWLCSPAASYVAGHAMMVDGGLSAQ